MVSWGTRRKYLIVASFAILFLGVFSLYGFVTFYEPASCFDGKQNKDEVGIDCGGSCVRFCEDRTLNLLVHWQRFFYINDGMYNAVAYIENTDPRSGSQSVSYVFKLYDRESVLVAERAGTVTIPPQRIVPVFEGAITTGHRLPFRSVFEFEGRAEWVSLRDGVPSVRVVREHLQDENTLPLLQATLENRNNIELTDVEVIAIIYDRQNNAQTASKTVIPYVEPLGSSPLLFSWPSPFGFTVGRIEIVPRLYPGVNF